MTAPGLRPRKSPVEAKGSNELEAEELPIKANDSSGLEAKEITHLGR